jgi:glycosyltransferase involved in cell wall biosynthesis
MIRDWVSRGHEVYTCAPETGFEGEIEDLGASFSPVRLARTGLNPLEDFLYGLDLIAFFRKVKPEMVFCYTIKPVIYGSLAASFSTVPKIFSMITGAGFAFEEGRNRLLKSLLLNLYRAALSRNTCVIFQNPDDQGDFFEHGLIGEKTATYLVNGSGINLGKFNFSEPKSDPIRFILIARLIPEKGVFEFVKAAREIKRNHKNVVFSLLGPLEERRGAITKEDVSAWEKEGTIEYLGKTNDVRPFLKNASVFVLPSYYREGVPRSILEALSIGRPVITTTRPGCKETVIPGCNGFLVKEKNIDELIKSMLYFLDNPAEIRRMGIESRILAEKRFDVNIVNREISSIMEL